MPAVVGKAHRACMLLAKEVGACSMGTYIAAAEERVPRTRPQEPVRPRAWFPEASRSLTPPQSSHTPSKSLLSRLRASGCSCSLSL